MQNNTSRIPRLKNEFLLIIIGMCFFANPMIALLDIIPDFIGCLLIMLAISKFTSISGDLENAYTYFKYMAFISAARLVFFIMNPGFDDIMLLTLTMAFGVVEFICMFLAIPSLYDGLSQMSLKYGDGTKEMPEFRPICFVFFGVRAFGAILPHVTAILTGGDDELITNEAMATASYTALLTLVNVVLTLIVAVFFVIAVVSFIGRVARDKAMRIAIYAEIDAKNSSDPEFFIRRQLERALKLLGISFIFLIDVFGDGINYIPDFFFGFIAMWAIFKMRNQLENTRGVLISGGVYTVFAIVNHFVYNDFMERRFFVAFTRIITQHIQDYIFALIFAVIETVALIVFVSKLAKHLKPIAVEYSIPEVPKEFARLNSELEETSMLQLRTLKRFRLFGMLVAILGTALTAVLHLTAYYDIPYWMLHSGINLLFFIYAYVLCYRFRQGVLKRYERPSDVI